MRRCQRKKHFLLFFLTLFLSPMVMADSSSTAAQRAVDQEQQRLRVKTEAEERQQRLDAPSIHLEREAAEAKTTMGLSIPSETPCHRITEVQFDVPKKVPLHIRQQSGTALPQDIFYFLGRQASAVYGRCIGKQGVAALIDKLMLDLVARGYTTTRVGVEADQNLSSGLLKLTLLPGYLRAFRFNGGDANARMAFPVRPGQVLNLRALEQGLEQMQRVGSLEVAMQLVPGDLPGETDVVLNLKRRTPWRLGLSLDDSGSNATGKYQLGANFSLDDPLGLNDTLTLGITKDAQFEESNLGTRGANVSYSIPWGNWTFTTTGSYNTSHQTLPNQVNKNVTHSNNGAFDAKISYMLMRDQVQKNTVEFRVGKRFVKAWNNVLEQHIDQPQSYRNVTFAEWSWLHRRYLGAAKFDLTATYRKGVPWLGSLDDTTTRYMIPDQNFIDGILHYDLKIIDATFSMPFLLFGQSANYSINFHGQFTQTRQDSANMMSIGGRYNVRGFDGATTLLAEQGYYVRNEIQVPIGKTAQSFYWGVDAGRVFGPQTASGFVEGTQLAGTAVGLRGSLFKGSSYEVFVGTPLYQPAGFGASGSVVGFNLRQDF